MRLVRGPVEYLPQSDPRFLRGVSTARQRAARHQARKRAKARLLRWLAFSGILLVGALAWVVAVPLLISVFAAHVLRAFEAL